MSAPWPSSGALLVPLDALVALLVVDFSRFGRREDLVGVAYFDEFLVRGLGVGVFVWMVLLAEGAVGFF